MDAVDPDLPPAKLVCSRDQRRTRSSLPRTDLKKCLICQEDKRDGRDRRRLEKLTRCEGDSTPGKLLNAAQIRRHDRILLEIDQQDLWAKDILYHVLCYKVFTSPRALHLIMEKEMAEEDAGDDLREAKTRAFAKLTAYVEQNVIEQPETVTNMADLCSKFVECLNDEGVSLVSYKTYMLKARLANHFGEALTFDRPRKRTLSEYVFNSSVPPGPLIDKCVMALSAMERAADLEMGSSATTSLSSQVSADSSPAADLFRAALFLRSEILSMEDTVPKPSDVPEDKIIVPNSLFNFLPWVLLGDVVESAPVSLERVPVESHADTRQVLSLAQDFIHCATRGRKKPRNMWHYPLQSNI